MCLRLLLLILLLQLFGLNCPAQSNKPIVINWINTLEGDFSFADKWDYPEGVYWNKFGQLDCDGICPPELDNMKDGVGEIFKDSLGAFYALVDTAHQVHSISCEAHYWEFAGTDYIDCKKLMCDTILCSTQCNVSTHSRLVLQITGSECLPQIKLLSVSNAQEVISTCTGGYINIDKGLWKKGTMKASFNFTFDGSDHAKEPFYWKGNIYSKIN